MKKNNDMGKEIFSIYGVIEKGDKYGLFGKKPHKFSAFENGIAIRVDLEVNYIKKEDINHMSRYYHVFEDDEYACDCLQIDYNFDGGGHTYTITESTFPNVTDKMLDVYKNDWGRVSQEHPQTVKWIITVIANWLIIMERPYDFFGTPGQVKSQVEDEREILVEDWGIKRKSELISALEDRFEFRLLDQAKNYYGFGEVDEDDEYENYRDEDEIDEIKISFEREKVREAIVADFDKTMKAFDLYRVILLAYLGLNSKYLSYEEALDWCLRAGLELQNLYSSWDDYYENYLTGYCFWSNEDADLDYTHSNRRKVVYEEVKKYKSHPWQIDWNTKLTKEW